MNPGLREETSVMRRGGGGYGSRGRGVKEQNLPIPSSLAGIGSLHLPRLFPRRFVPGCSIEAMAGGMEETLTAPWGHNRMSRSRD